MHSTRIFAFLRARRAHCAYRRVAPSALLNGAPSARWSYPEKNLPLAVFHSSLASARRLALCAPEGRIAPIGASNPESHISSRIERLIPHNSAPSARNGTPSAFQCFEVSRSRAKVFVYVVLINRARICCWDGLRLGETSTSNDAD